MNKVESNICRICLTYIHNDSYKNLLSTIDNEIKPLVTIKTMLNDVVSEINVELTENSVLCIPCYEELCIAYSFKIKCLKTESVIRNYLSDETERVDLSRVCNLLENKDTVIPTETLEEELIVIELENDNNSDMEANETQNDTNEVDCKTELNVINVANEKKDDNLSNKEQAFECTSCCISFPDYESLVTHAQNVHKIDELYNCKVCQNIFRNPVRAQEHALQHIGNGKYSCDDMIRILPFYLKGTPKTCPECFKSFLWCCQFKQKPSELCCKCLGHRGTFTVILDKTTELLEKKKSHSQIEQNVLQCHFCSKVFSFQNDLDKHKQTHQVKRYSCGECEKKFSRKTAVEDHIEIIHKGLGALRCHKCGRCYTKRDSFNKHLRSHEGEVFNICEICGKNFMSSSDLSKHIRRHMGDKKHQCPTCGKLFVMRYAMIEHERTHDQNYKINRRRYVCEVCGKVLSAPGSLMIHKAKHCGVKRYKCDICDKTFRFKRQLQSHSEDHKQVQKHKCNICKLNYASWWALKKHQKLQHIVPSKETEGPQSADAAEEVLSEEIM